MSDFHPEGDLALRAWYRFESCGIGLDSISTNHLTSSVYPSLQTKEVMEGTSSGEFSSTSGTYLAINDSSLSPEFPLRSSDTTKRITVCAWIYPTASGARRHVWAKSDSVVNKCSLALVVDNGTLKVEWGTATGSAYTSYSTGITINNNHWYHVAVTADGVFRTLTVYTYSLTGATDLTTYTTTTANELWVGDVAFTIGSDSGHNATTFWDGYIDNVLVFDRVLSKQETWRIRSLEYNGTPYLLLDGFESGSLDGWVATYYAEASASSTHKRTGSYALRIDTLVNNQYVRNMFSSLPFTHLYAQFAMYFTQFDRKVCSFGNVDGTQLGLTVDASGYLHLWTGDFVTDVGTSSVSIATSTWNVIDSYLVSDNTNGTWQFWINNVAGLTYSGDTNINGTGINTITLHGQYIYVDYYFDDVVIMDATGPNVSRPNGLRLTYLKPTANVATSWTPSTGLNYACIDDVPFSTSDYISAGSTYLIDVYEVEDLPSDAVSVKVVAPSTYGRIEGDFNGVDQLQIVSGATYTSQLVQLGYETQSATTVFNKNPITGDSYTVEEVNSMKLGLRSR